MIEHPRLLTRRQWRGKYRQIRCALCYLRLWPWEPQTRGANYFPHPYMRVHRYCGGYYVRSIDAARALRWSADRENQVAATDSAVKLD